MPARLLHPPQPRH
ncbi:hypothetical protein LINPERPRIM_LOCUS40783 [Linum perenne]